jgi:rod shape-determining protein MreC
MLRVQERENRRLRKLLSLKEHHDFPTAAAQVIGEDALGWYRALIIDRGSQDGVLPGMPANAPAGVVGRVSTTSGSVSKVMLITDPGLSLDCRVARTRDRGVLSGYLAKQCIVRYVDLGSGVKSGDEVVTSGLDGIFPRNLPVGTVDQVRKDSQGMFVEALVKPSVNFSELEEVLIILGARDGFDIRPGLDDKR